MAYMVLAAGMNIAVLVFLAVQVIGRYPVNHAFNPWPFGSVLVPSLGSLLAPWLMSARWRWAVCGSWITLLAVLTALDVFTVLVSHETFCSRGLAKWGTPVWTIEAH